MTQIGTLLRTARKAKGMSQKEVAIRMNLHQSQYSRMEIGQHDLTFGMMERFCGAIEISISELVSCAEQPPMPNPERNKEQKILHSYHLKLDKIPHAKRKSIFALIDLVQEELKTND